MSTTLTLTDAQVTALAPLLAAIGVAVEPSAPADQAPAKAEPRFRSEAQKAKGHANERAIYSAHYTAAGVSTWKGLSAKQQAACKAEIRTMWAGIKGTRKTSTKG